jgi:iron complex transport system permease protein
VNGPLSPRRRARALLATVVVVVVVVVACLGIGPDGAGWPDAMMLSLRAGRVAVAFVVGAALSTTGAALQALLRNSLADPYVLGVSGGAALGAALVTALGSTITAAAVVSSSSSSLSSSLSSSWAALGVPAGGVIGAALASALLLAFVTQRGRAHGGERTVLVGVVLNAFSWAFVAVVRAVVPASSTQALSVWLVGAVAYPDATTLGLAALATVGGVVVVARNAGALRLLRHGDDEAVRLGVDVVGVRRAVLAACTVLVGVAVATTGVIGFVGLLVPHALRRLVSDDERALVPVAALGGGALLCAVDAVGRGAFVVVGGELPAGALCALVGAPGFAWLLWREGRR